MRRSADFTGIVISVVHPKAKWWLLAQDVRCFHIPNAGSFCAIELFQAYCSLAPTPLLPGGPAFVDDAGKILTRDFMVSRTVQLLAAAGISQLDSDGATCEVYSSSWRAGAVRSAKDANVSDPVIMSWGRWSSNAWTNYLSQTALDLSKAALAAWIYAVPTPHTTNDFWMGESARPSPEPVNMSVYPADYEALQIGRLVTRSALNDDRPAKRGPASLPASYLAYLAAHPD